MIYNRISSLSLLLFALLLFSLEDSAAEAEGAQFAGPPRDFGIDEDGDGRFEKLRVDLNVEVDTPDRYVVSGWLRSPSYDFPGFAEKTLSAGKHTVSVDFDGRMLRRMRLDGPYQGEYMIHKRDIGDVLRLGDGQRLALTTGPWKWRQFQGSGVEFTGTYIEHPVDDNGDGKYEQLVIEVEVEATKAGQYTVQGRLSRADRSIPNAEASASPSSADTKMLIPLKFPTADFAMHRVDGPYSLKALQLLSGEETMDHIENTGPVTKAYPYQDFKSSPLSLDPHGITERARDSDEDGLIDSVEMKIDVLSTATTDLPYSIDVSLADSANTTVAAGWQRGIARPGKTEVTIGFKGSDIEKSKKSGPYVFRDITLWGEEGAVDTIKKGPETKAYQAGQFGAVYRNLIASSLLIRRDGITEVVRDYNADGLFDSLEVKVPVLSSAKASLSVQVSGVLRDADGRVLAEDSAHTTIISGASGFGLNFNGSDIRKSRMNGPYFITDVTLFDEQSPIVQLKESMKTKAYRFDQFGPME